MNDWPHDNSTPQVPPPFPHPPGQDDEPPLASPAEPPPPGQAPAPPPPGAAGNRRRGYIPPPAEPFSIKELRTLLLRPYLVVEYVLGGKDRLARNLSRGPGVWYVVGLLLVTGLVSTVPYGCLSPAGSFWKIAVLYTGSLLICLPCLHVFSQFLGFRFNLAQNFAMALVITCVAGLFTFAFFPIIWFIDFTTRCNLATVITPADLSTLLLGISLLIGVLHMWRCLLLRGGMTAGSVAFQVLIFCWLPLLVFITFRMARLFDLLPL